MVSELYGFPVKISETDFLGDDSEPISIKFGGWLVADYVYAWERTLSFGEFMTERQFCDFIKNICDDYHISHTNIRIHDSITYDGTECAYYDDIDHSIVVPRYACCSSVGIHEVAHAIHEVYGSMTDNRHGPEYVRLLCELRKRYMNEDFIFDSARENKLDIASKWWSVGTMAYRLGIPLDS